jgi:hypothetical protein
MCGAEAPFNHRGSCNLCEDHIIRDADGVIKKQHRQRCVGVSKLLLIKLTVKESVVEVPKAKFRSSRLACRRCSLQNPKWP